MNRPLNLRAWVRTVLIVALVWLAAGCGDSTAKMPSAGATSQQPESVAPRLVCMGRVEPVEGEIEVSAQMAGTLDAVQVKEGDWVEKGTLLATVAADREQAQLRLAQARLARVKAGIGAEEIAAVIYQRESLEAELTYAQQEESRARKLHATAAITDDELEAKQKRVTSLRKQIESLRKQHEAMKRGPLPEEIVVAEAEMDAARTNYELRQVRALSAGTVLHLYRHTGDYVSGNWPTPILRMADTNRLHVRLEVAESDVAFLRVGMEGPLAVFGSTNALGQLMVQKILPSFGPKRLFDPDGNARLDTRTLQVLCEIRETRQPVFSGQRVLVTFAAP